MEKQIVENLWNGDSEAQIQAAMELSKLCNKHRHNLAESGVMVPLVSMLHSGNYETIEASLSALLSFSFGSERNKIRIVKSGALPILLNLIHCESQEVVQLSLASMLALSSCKANKVAIASAGAVRILVEFINGSSTQSQLDAIATLHNLTTCQQIIPMIVSSCVILSLLELIHSSVKSSALVEKAIGLLENIVSSSEKAVGILLLICQSCREKYRVLILTEGVMPGLLQLSVDGTWRAKSVARELLLLLRDCSSYRSRRKQINHELVEQIMDEIDAEGEKLADSTLRMVEEMISKLHT